VSAGGRRAETDLVEQAEPVPRQFQETTLID
jgi:hypothetical protein